MSARHRAKSADKRAASSHTLLKDDIPKDQHIRLTQLFCDNQANFYRHIQSTTSVPSHTTISPHNPIVYTQVNTVDVIFSPSVNFAFYNTILSTDLHKKLDSTSHDPSATLSTILKHARRCNVPIRMQTSTDAIQTHRLLKRNRFIELPSRPDSYQYIDLYDPSFSADLNYKHWLKAPHTERYVISELDDSVKGDVEQNKHDKGVYGQILAEAFGFTDQPKHQRFYSAVWSNVVVGPTTPVRMFVVRDMDGDGEICGGAHLSCNDGVGVIFNVVNLKKYRGNGVGAALSIQCVAAAKAMEYRYVLLQASALGNPVYKKIGFQNLPPYKTFLKLGTAAWWCGALEAVIVLGGMQNMQVVMAMANKPVQLVLVPAVSYMLVIYALMTVLISTVMH